MRPRHPAGLFREKAQCSLFLDATFDPELDPHQGRLPAFSELIGSGIEKEPANAEQITCRADDGRDVAERV